MGNHWFHKYHWELWLLLPHLLTGRWVLFGPILFEAVSATIYFPAGNRSVCRACITPVLPSKAGWLLVKIFGSVGGVKTKISSWKILTFKLLNNVWWVVPLQVLVILSRLLAISTCESLSVPLFNSYRHRLFSCSRLCRLDYPIFLVFHLQISRFNFLSVNWRQDRTYLKSNC